MKRKSLKTLMLLISFATSTKPSVAQDATVTMPDFKYQIMVVKKDNTLANLDKTPLSTKSKMAGIGSTKVYYEADGCCAKVSLSGSVTEKYIIRIDPGMDPEAIVELYQFQDGRNSRKLLLKKITMGGALTGNLSKHNDLSSIHLNFKKVADGVYLISLDEQLIEGEYIFQVKSAYNNASMSEQMNQQYAKGYCFSVGRK